MSHSYHRRIRRILFFFASNFFRRCPRPWAKDAPDLGGSLIHEPCNVWPGRRRPSTIWSLLNNKRPSCLTQSWMLVDFADHQSFWPMMTVFAWRQRRCQLPTTSSRPIPWFSWGKPVRKVASFWSVVFLGPLWTQHNLKHTHIYIYIDDYICMCLVYIVGLFGFFLLKVFT